MMRMIEEGVICIVRASTRQGGVGDVVRHRQVYCHHQGGGEGGGEEEGRVLVNNVIGKKTSFFCCVYVVVCFDPIAANRIDVIHGCGRQEGG